jgi:hypothetical protein
VRSSQIPIKAPLDKTSLHISDFPDLRGKETSHTLFGPL